MVPESEMKRVGAPRESDGPIALRAGSKMIAQTSARNRRDMELRASAVSKLLRSLANRNRLMIACALVEREYAVGELENELGIHQPTLSQQLTVLRAARIVETRREAKQIFYRLTDDRAARLLEALHVIFCRDDDHESSKTIRGAASRLRK